MKRNFFMILNFKINNKLNNTAIDRPKKRNELLSFWRVPAIAMIVG